MMPLLEQVPLVNTSLLVLALAGLVVLHVRLNYVMRLVETNQRMLLTMRDTAHERGASTVSGGVVMVISLLLGVAPAVLAQPAPTVLPFPVPAGTRLVWDHDGVNTTRYEVRVNGARQVDNVSPVAGGVQAVPFPIAGEGDFTIIVGACTAVLCVDSEPFRVVIRSTVPAPTGLSWRTNTLTWTHTGELTNYFEVFLDGVSASKVGVTAGQTAHAYGMTLSPAAHVIRVRACRETSTAPMCVDSDPLRVPGKPGNLRLGGG